MKSNPYRVSMTRVNEKGEMVKDQEGRCFILHSISRAKYERICKILGEVP